MGIAQAMRSWTLPKPAGGGPLVVTFSVCPAAPTLTDPTAHGAAQRYGAGSVTTACAEPSPGP